MRKIIIPFIVFMIIGAGGCSRSKKNTSQNVDIVDTKETKASPALQKNTVEEILLKPEIPILCYHRITEGRNDAYSVSPSVFSSHLQLLADSGYTSILPEQLYDYLVYNKELPRKPVMITFDDSRIEHIEIAAPELEKRGFRGAFFIMTITYNKKNYMSTDEIADLAQRGHCVGLHSWDHTMATKYLSSEDWEKQTIKPKEKLELILKSPVRYWAYPNGVYNHDAAKKLDGYFDLSFILMSKRDSLLPLQTVRRMIVPTLKPEKLLSLMHENFSKK